MIELVRIFSWPDLRAFLDDGRKVPKDARFISVLSPGVENGLFPRRTDTALPLWFDDIGPSGMGSNPWMNEEREIGVIEGCEAFSTEQATDVVDTVVKWQREQTEVTVIINCEAGISRSAAIGLFIVDYVGLDFIDFQRRHPRILPNEHVYGTLMKMANNMRFVPGTGILKPIG